MSGRLQESCHKRHWANTAGAAAGEGLSGTRSRPGEQSGKEPTALQTQSLCLEALIVSPELLSSNRFCRLGKAQGSSKPEPEFAGNTHTLGSLKALFGVLYPDLKVLLGGDVEGTAKGLRKVRIKARSKCQRILSEETTALQPCSTAGWNMEPAYGNCTSK